MISETFLRGILLKVAFKPEPLRKAQAMLLYVALTGEEFTGDVITRDVSGEDIHLSGCAVATLSKLHLIQYVRRMKSPSKSRNGAFTNVWRLGDGKANLAKEWLKRNSFPVEEPKMKQAEINFGSGLRTLI